jgi:hypothetical protein
MIRLPAKTAESRLLNPDRHDPAAFRLGPAWLAGRGGGGGSYF